MFVLKKILEDELVSAVSHPKSQLPKLGHTSFVKLTTPSVETSGAELTCCLASKGSLPELILFLVPD